MHNARHVLVDKANQFEITCYRESDGKLYTFEQIVLLTQLEPSKIADPSENPGQPTVKGGLAGLLLENAERDCVCNMPHKEIAEHLRVCRESATTAFGELIRAGIVSIERQQIRILDRARLERAARE